MVTNRVVFVKSPGGVVVVRSKAINHLPGSGPDKYRRAVESILIYLKNTSGI